MKGREQIKQALDGRRATAPELTDLTGLGAGRLYPLLLSMEMSGEIQSKWVEEEYPRRRVYFLAGMEF